MTDENHDFGVKHSLWQELTADFDETLVGLVGEELPDPWKGEIAPTYRLAVAELFIDLRGAPRKRERGKMYRTDAESRLDRAFTKVADAYDKSEPAIRKLCVQEIYSGSDPTAQFRSDLVSIKEQYLK